ncbi:hypothetical protein Tco_1548586 [Tanacetum coccineum]
MFSPNTPSDVQKEFCDRLGVKVLHKLQGWKHKFLSQAGREILRKVVIQAISSYAMHCYMLPKDCGGLGFRDLSCFNLALLAKQGWRLFINPCSFWGRVLKGIYFLRLNFLNATKGSHPSWLWQSLLQGRDLLLHGIRWQVGNGSNIQFWTEKWVPYQDDFYIRKPRCPFASNALVSDFITNGEWDLSKLQLCVHLEEVKFISQIPISSTSLDKIVCHYEPNGNYTVKSGYYQVILQREVNSKPEDSSSSTPNKSLWKQVWNLKTLPKIKMFWWKACLNALATYENLS